ncbi:homing endonuclease [Citrobacter phage CF1 ERZ-2017]|uniref:HNH nuclease domain-containing protein n=1 Tax=Citrobacter phage CF1 ERZ-2017 TaxID=2267236 RepID=A0A2H4YG39_9CAUD|nr:homing endonuclease [Citrobacter phage CF1 ERZ-2017]AUE23129.1 hypothetical protein Cf1_00266 [Citrobacter phage CF1 ERZ-2017]
MNYQKIYDSLVERRKASPFIGYTENHHIIPKCMGGSDDKENLVALSAREHFVAHLLLCKIHEGHFGLASAMVLMTTDKANNRLNNRLYELHRKLFSKNNSMFFKEYWKNNPHPRGMSGKHHTEECKRQISKSCKASIATIKIHQFSLDGEFIKTFNSMSEAAESVSGSVSNIKYCAEGCFQYAYGFRWSYSLIPNFDKIKPRNYKGARGKICVNNGFKNKLIESSEPIPDGWVRGRVKVNK